MPKCKGAARTFRNIQTGVIHLQWQLKKRVGMPSKVIDAMQVYREGITKVGDLYSSLSNVTTMDPTRARQQMSDAEQFGHEVPWPVRKTTYQSSIHDLVFFNQIDELFLQLEVTASHMLNGADKLNSKIINVNASLLENRL